jgi:predicted phosphoribosyltransferase
MVRDARPGEGQVSAALFADRFDAGAALARTLVIRQPQLPASHPVVLAIPRGGVPVGFMVARALQAPLDVFIARKLGAPGHEELGIGAVAPGGVRVLDRAVVAALRVPDDYLDAVTAREMAEVDRRMRAYRGDAPPPDVRGRTIVLVDDGLATGVTVRAALAALRESGASQLIAAAPVCSSEARDLVGREADAVVCAAVPPRFDGVGLWYEDFTQTSDDEVLDLLHRAALPPTAPTPGAP